MSIFQSGGPAGHATCFLELNCGFQKYIRNDRRYFGIESISWFQNNVVYEHIPGIILP